MTYSRSRLCLVRMMQSVSSQKVRLHDSTTRGSSATKLTDMIVLHKRGCRVLLQRRIAQLDESQRDHASILHCLGSCNDDQDVGMGQYRETWLCEQ